MSASVHALRTAGREPSIEPLMQLVAPALNSVNEIILARMQSDVSVIPALAGHLISGGGKRLRPMLTLASARLLDYEGTRHHKLSAAVEFIHTATLLHDDVVDGSEQRRGKKAANLIWGNQATVLVGDFLFSRAFELMVEDGSLKVLKILSGASAVIAQGEVDQLQTQRRIDTTEERYLQVITAKTAVLFAAACQIAGVVSERGEEVEAKLESFGRNLGIAFQLVDDAIDYAGNEAEMGKDAGDDFREGKLTLPVILAYKRGDAAAKRFWERAIGSGDGSDDDLAEAIAHMRAADAISDTLERARHYGRLAIDAIADFPAGKAKDALTETVAFAVARGY
ncbi:farnesyltranstransferase [Pacificimonas flava]|uniref:Octaprenyl diphosphate synthase n=2 Tax=Pacificimonas TaxID=1960290 RepID=A0A219B6Y9_9SPHN|nr:MULTISPECIES: polyprenyl synthetase family protein [Pacificimonas]MBZ6378871.1 polyprenyl synthetase family protein [Pacificimonas aurantium]OWV33876.1 farnesyltranstransferase [Pacificimonas flava]